MAGSSAKQGAQQVLEARRGDLVRLSHDMWDHPEIAFEEEHASSICSNLLADAGFDVQPGASGLDTAFVAEYGSGPLTVGICAELDALPGIGHACGHNMIAASGVGAGVALAQVADEVGITVRVLGTPAEEGGGGKVFMVEAGDFDGVHLAMMVHPAPVEADVFPALARHTCAYHFTGKTAHPSLAPNLGINAADAITVGPVGVGPLRQHLEPTDQVHGLVIDGGEAVNIVPGSATARYAVRAPTIDDLKRLEPRVRKCFEAGALATGATLDVESAGPAYTDFRHEEEIASLYRANAESLGRTFIPRPEHGAGSTDMANISLLMPAIHPTLGLDCAPAVNHQPEFAAYCRTEEADHALIDGAMSMAWTSIDAASDSSVAERLLAADTSYGGRSAYPWTF